MGCTGHTNAQSMVDQIANGSAGDLMNQLSYSTMAGGARTAPMWADCDTAKILASSYGIQYIPAWPATDDTLNLRLNVAPVVPRSKSVVVVAMPPIGRQGAAAASGEPGRELAAH